MSDQMDSLTERGREAAAAADDYVHTKPWQMIGVAAVAALARRVLPVPAAESRRASGRACRWPVSGTPGRPVVRSAQRPLLG